MKFIALALAQHMLSAARCRRTIQAASKWEAETIAMRDLANTDWYLVQVIEMEG